MKWAMPPAHSGMSGRGDQTSSRSAIRSAHGARCAATVGTLFHHAQAAGWRETRRAKGKKMNGGLGDDPFAGLDDEAELARLAKLSPVEYARQRKAAAERLNVRVSFLDDEIKARRKNQSAAGENQFLEHWQ